jgi:ferredoxin/flavodoxin---NADP+ reductase
MKVDMVQPWYRNQKMHKVQITNQQEIAPGSYLTSFERSFEFNPGQVIMVTTGGELPARMYSLASGNNEKECRILYDCKPEGQLTPRLAALRPGDSFYISAPFGSFICVDGPVVWIATGTGLAPFLSMALSGILLEKYLIHGSRTLKGFYQHNELSDLLGNRYTRCCSQEKDEGIFYGRVTEYLRTQAPLTSTCFYYLCGSAEMVVDVRQVLMELGIPYNRIMAEIYF